MAFSFRQGGRDLYSFRGIKELVGSKKNFGLDPFDTLSSPLISPVHEHSSNLPLIENKTCRTKSFKKFLKSSVSSKVISTFGVGELKFRKVFKECNTIRKQLKVIKQSCNRKKSTLKELIKECRKALRDADKNTSTNPISAEFDKYKMKIKQKQNLKKLPNKSNKLLQLELTSKAK